MFEFIIYILVACTPFILICFWVNEIPKIIKKYEDSDKNEIK